jgi:AcrR family transcriptional regulator
MAAKPRRSRTRTPRTGRRPGKSDTRVLILLAARALFAERGYEATTMRAVAAEAGVDAALVVHYFTNKLGLFLAAVEWPFDPDREIPRMFRRGGEHVGEELVSLFVETWDREGERNTVITLLRSAVSDGSAAVLVREFMRDELFEPAMKRLGSDHAQLRADLVASQLLGLGLVRYVLRLEPLASTPPHEVIAAVSPTVQRYFTGPLS